MSVALGGEINAFVVDVFLQWLWQSHVVVDLFLQWLWQSQVYG
jgi:hypothetical protein